MNNEQHYSTQQLVDYLDGHLDATSSSILLMHLETGCPACNESFLLYNRIISGIKSLHWQAPSPTIHKRVVSQFRLHYPEKTKTNTSFFPQFRPAFLGFAVVAIVIFALLFSINKSVVSAGYVEEVTGQVELFDASSNLWKPVSIGQSLPVNARVRTMANSQLTIAFPGGEKTLLRSNTEIQIESIDKTQGLWQISLDQNSGLTENVTAPSTMQLSITTSAGVFDGSYAHFIVDINYDGTVTTDVFEGTVFSLSNSKLSSIHPGQSLVIPAGNNETIDSAYFENINLKPILTPLSEERPTKTPNNLMKQTITPTPKSNPNSGTTCNPGNSNGAGNSGNANNAAESCK